MNTILFSLALILAVCAFAPFLASLVPGRAVPEVVFLVFAGAILGAHGLKVINTSSVALSLVSDLGLGFLFLKAGYEIDPRELVGHSGRVAAASWVASLAVGSALVPLFANLGLSDPAAWMALAIAMTTTAYGTLAPILRDRGLTETRVGRIVTVHGAFGELLPVIAMSFLLSSRSTTRTLASFAVFGLIALLVLGLSAKAKYVGARFWRFLVNDVGHASQPLLRMVSAVLVLLLLAVTYFDFDAVLGAFAAGFILRALFPEGNEQMEEKIDIISNGFFQPAFFVISGAGIDLAAATQNLPLLFGFMGALVLVRGVMVALSLRLDPGTRDLGWRELVSVAAYCTMALPLVVAVTSVAVEGGVMASQSASVLVTAAALTVLVIPVLTSFVRVADEADVAAAVLEVAHGEGSLREVVEGHSRAYQERQRVFREQRRLGRSRGLQISSADYLAGRGRASRAEGHRPQSPQE
ncbi:cation:proton antiporter [uncultured Olsenella sp.]|uniref:cation:proton antiporter n=1 Tax=uncultured Olsenella sp. TaxID=190764 RepID=UPI0026DD744D|nr:cation:proton antiporter [uncultured Olsenella sp.]